MLAVQVILKLILLASCCQHRWLQRLSPLLDCSKFGTFFCSGISASGSVCLKHAAGTHSSIPQQMATLQWQLICLSQCLCLMLAEAAWPGRCACQCSISPLRYACRSLTCYRVTLDLKGDCRAHQSAVVPKIFTCVAFLRKRPDQTCRR